MSPTLVKIGLRSLRQHPLQTALTLLGVMLGVAVVVAVDLANASARRAMALSVEMSSGSATHHIEGGPGGVPEEIYRRLRTELGLRRSAPRVSDEVRRGDERLTLVGFDPFAHDFTRPLARPGPGQAGGRRLLLEPATVAMTAQTAARLGISVHQHFPITHRGERHEVELVHLFDSRHPGATGLLLADIAVAQELLGRVGVLDRIDLALDDAGELARLRDWLPPELSLVEARSRNRELLQMSGAFHTNLTAMSLLALLVGGFLIYSTMSFAVLRRRAQFGTLRALGVSREELYLLVLLEAAALGLLATGAGLAGGVALGQLLVERVAGTIDDLYYRLHVSGLFVSGLSLLKGFLLGIVATALAAWLPARTAARTTPVSLQRNSRREARRGRAWFALCAAGLVLASCGAGMVKLPGGGLLLGFTALAMAVVGFSLAVPLAVRGFCAAAGLLRGGGPLLRLGVRGIDAGLGRTGLAIAALTLAIATTLGVGIMIGSFRQAVVEWLERSLVADVHVSLPGPRSGVADRGLPPKLIESLRNHPQVRDSRARRVLLVATDRGRVRLTAVAPPPEPRELNFRAGDPLRALATFAAGGGLLVAEPFATRQGLKVDDEITFRSPAGEVALPVVGIFSDYTTGHGLIYLSLSRYRQLWGDEGVSSLSLYRRPQIAAVSFADTIRRLVAEYDTATGEATRVVDNGEIRAASLAIFERTFTVTGVLRLLSLAVAFIGVLTALLALQLEKGQEFALLRACGVTPGAMRAMVVGQTLLIGLFAGVLALPLGWLMAALLVEVINVRAFGWSMQLVLPPAALWQAPAVALAAALLAGLYPAREAARLPVARTLRQE